MKNGKPSISEIRDDLLPACEKAYNTLFQKIEDGERFYELSFSDDLLMPKEFEDSGIVLPTARDIVDTFVDHIDLVNARVFVNKKGISEKAIEEAEMMRKLYLGILYRTNLDADISPWRVAGKHVALTGVSWMRTLWSPDVWPNKPLQKTDESDEDYAIRMDEWRHETQKAIPIAIEAIHPRHIMPDPSYGGRLYLFEKHTKLVFDTLKMFPKWSNPKKRKVGEEVEYIIYWDNDYRCDFIDGEPVIQVQGGVAKHKYGFIPYTCIDSGLGNLSYDNLPEMRYVGILDYIKDMLISESRNYSLNDVVLAKTAFPSGFFEGANAKAVQEFSMEFGKWTRLPEGVKPIFLNQAVPSEALNAHLFRTSDYIAAHAAPRSVRGLGESGVRSGADRRLVIAEASTRYGYAKEAFANGAAKVLGNCARILKDVVPGDVRVWARTPTDEFDMMVSKDKLKEPFTCYVEFSPISEEDEYRRHDDLERLTSAGIVTRRWARTQMSNVDPLAMEHEEEVQRLRDDPMLSQVVSQYVSSKLAEAISRKEAESQLKAGIVPMSPNMGMNAPVAGATPMIQPSTGAGRRLVPPIPNRAAPGSAGELQNQMQGMRSQTPMSPTQGMGGGGNRP